MSLRAQGDAKGVGPDQLRLLAKIARMYHERGVRQPQIAADLGISQSRVSRMLRLASDLGIVRTTVMMPEGVHTDLEDAVEAKYGLRECVIVEVDGGSEDVIPALGAVAAGYVSTTLMMGDDIVGISSWSATLLATVEAMRPHNGAPTSIITQLVGGVVAAVVEEALVASDLTDGGGRDLHALEAGQEAGGDARGRQGAGLLIVREEGGYQGGDDRYADLRVEDHVEPILELRRVYDVWMRLFHPADHFVPRGRTAISAPTGPHICELRRILTVLGYDSYEGTDGPCVFDEEVIPALRAFQRDQDLPETAGLDETTARRLREAAASVDGS
jgi:DNA-binding Lrp family transcriptional regulator